MFILVGIYGNDQYFPNTRYKALKEILLVYQVKIYFCFFLPFYYIVFMTDKIIQIKENRPDDPLIELAKTLEEQADYIVNNNLKAIKQNISSLSHILDQLGVKN